MAKVFVANTTQQIQEFSYRMLEGQKLIMQRILVGQQVQLPGNDWQPADIQYLEEQHRRYGLVPVSEVDRTRAFIGVCYSVDKPVPIDAIRKALVANVAVLEERGRAARTAAAVAATQEIEEKGVGLRRFEMSLHEEGEAATLAEGIRVDRMAPEGGADSEGGRRGKPSRRRA